MNAATKGAPPQHIQAWIDVGGTFTDCYVIADTAPALQTADGPRRQRLKVLSSGLVPISCAAGSTPTAIIAPELAADAAGFWRGAELRCYNNQREVVATVAIADFDPGSCRLVLSGPLAVVDEALSSPDGLSHLAFEIDPGIEAPVLAVRRLLGCPLEAPLPPLSIRLGTTRGTNALLTRRGAPTALAITAPFEDLLIIGDQTRPRLFDLAVRRDPPLTNCVVAIPQRMDAAGNILEPLDETRAREGLAAALHAGCQSLAICLLHSYRNPAHEVRLEQIAREVGFAHISRSSAIAPLIEIVARARTTVVDAYLGPIVRDYLQLLVLQFGGQPRASLQVMTSAGGLVEASELLGKDSILSGPAGGVVALRALAQATARPLLIGLDMGGTSTDVCRTAPDQTLEYESTKAGVRILTPTLPIETVASGGGSICWFDGVSLRVGPHSAGASPGPACYGRGGPLTITDLNVYLGRLPVDQLPFPIDRAAIEVRLAELERETAAAGNHFRSLEQLADGLRGIANQQMAEAARTISISQGADPRAHTLVGFGGAAGQHICEIAGLLGVAEIVDSEDAGLLSALGMGLADQRRDGALPVYGSLAEVDWPTLAQRSTELSDQLRSELSRSSSGVSEQAPVESRTWLELRYAGTDVPLSIAWTIGGDAGDLASRFHADHRRKFGYARPRHAIELVAVRVEAKRLSGVRLRDARAVPAEGRHVIELPASGRLWSGGHWRAVSHCPRAALRPGSIVIGPAIVLSPGSTLVVADGWSAEALSDGSLFLRHDAAAAVPASAADSEQHVDRQTGQISEPASTTSAEQLRDPISEAVFAQRLAAIATQMGLVLQQTALSVNVKQRRDFSCAVFDGHGRMLASAPHVPVHLGAMGATVRAAMRRYPDLAPGEVVITNDPYQGGSHLPDVTVISGIFRPGDPAPAMYVANRAHHADIGGMAPGSMSVSATRLGQEGAVIELLRLAEEECGELQPLREVLAKAAWPPRNIEENLADVRAQLAANARGMELVGDLQSTFGWTGMARLAEAVLAVAEQRVRNFIRTLPRQARRFSDRLDDGTLICVSIEPTQDDRLRIDFAGTGPTSPANFNANPSIVTAAVIYVLRCLIADELPLNEGMLAAVDLRVPPGLLDPPAELPVEDRPAVAAGNVETSQRIVDVLLGAFAVASASQGTMNNFLFGNARFGFYETICGGAGASPGCPGASGVHTHMTNTRLTDPEVLEAKYPARLRAFALRDGSGGKGVFAGGDGVVRTIEFLEPVEVSLLTSRRGDHRPYGMAGGAAGAAGVNTRIGRDGQRSALPSACHLHLEAGEAIEIQTPGGGGYGAE